MTAPSVADKRPNPTSKPATDPLTNTWTCYRKTFSLDRDNGAAPKSAIVKIAVDSKYWLWVNGELVVFEGGLKRGPNRTDSYVDSVDLAPHLKAGKNTIAILTWYFGREGFSHISSGMPALYFDADKLPIGDAPWKAIIHPAYGNTGAPQPNYRLPESNTHFDARKDIGDWQSESFDDSSWPAAVKLSAPPSAPWGKLHDRPTPLLRFSSLRDYTNAATFPKVSTTQPIIAKLPYDAQVTPYLKIDAPPGKLVDIRTDTYNTTGAPTLRTEYITKAGVQEFESLGWISGHEVHYTMPAGVKILALKYRESGYDTDFAGSFKCDDPMLNTLWRKAARTLYVNMRDNYSDCPDRERGQWWGDVVIDLGEAFYAFDRRSDAIIHKGLCELAAWQRPDGTMFSPIPAGNYDVELAPQILATVGYYGAWTYYFNTGDSATIRRIYPAIKKYLYLWKMGPDGLTIRRTGKWDWEDWGKNIDAPLLDNAWYVLALKSAIGMAHVVGADNDIAGYRQRIDSIQSHYDAAYWHNDEYRSAGYNGETDERGNAMAVLAGLAPPARYPAIRAVLDKHRNCSPYMEKYVLEAYFKMDDAAGGLARMKLRYGPMINDHLTTLWEQFSRNDGTYNHGWSGGPLTLLSQYVAGVAPIAVGYSKYEIRPELGDLNHVEATVPSAKGRIHVVISRTPGELDLSLDSPPGTEGKVMLPIGSKTLSRLEIDGMVIKDPKVYHGRVVFGVTPGKWNVKVMSK